MIFYVAMALFLANFALGVLVQFRIVDTKPFRWLHHALFFAVFASAAPHSTTSASPRRMRS